jgi:hypothetical protein
MLVEEEDKLAKDLGLLTDLTREIEKCQQWIERQRLRIEDLERDGHDTTAAVALLNRVTETLIIHQEYRQRVTRLEQTPPIATAGTVDPSQSSGSTGRV